MSTLIAIYDGAGQCVGRCDAKCHDAHEPTCRCICTAVNHGVGLERAIENTRSFSGTWLDARANGRQYERAELGGAVVAATLF